MKLDHSFLGKARSYDPQDPRCVYTVIEVNVEPDYRRKPYVRMRIQYCDGATAGFHLAVIQRDCPHES